jgi:hypothetical protein
VLRRSPAALRRRPIAFCPVFNHHHAPELRRISRIQFSSPPRLVDRRATSSARLLRRVASNWISAVVPPQPTILRLHRLQTPVSLPDYLISAVDAVPPPSNSAPAPNLNRARRRDPGEGSKREGYRWVRLNEAELTAPPRRSAVAWITGELFAGGGRIQNSGRADARIGSDPISLNRSTCVRVEPNKA